MIFEISTIFSPIKNGKKICKNFTRYNLLFFNHFQNLCKARWTKKKKMLDIFRICIYLCGGKRKMESSIRIFSKIRIFLATMETLSATTCAPHSGIAASTSANRSVNPEGGDAKIGKSVEYALLPNVKYWFPIRATHHRAQKIYDKIVSLRNDCLEPYLPILRHIEYTNEDFNNPTQYIADKPLDSGLLFLRSTLNDFRALLQYQNMFPGMTPFYNHFYVNYLGKNDFLTVPDRQMESFKIILNSEGLIFV